VEGILYKIYLSTPIIQDGCLNKRKLEKWKSTMMKIGIMQPYFIPYLGYFSLIDATDRWILFDTPQYIRHGWVNRNRVLKPAKDDWQYLSVPLEKHSQETTILDVSIKQNGWQDKMIAQLSHYKKKARYYDPVIGLLQDSFTKQKDDFSLVNLNAQLILDICTYCGMEIKIELFSEMDLTIGTVSAPDEWALEISKSLCATHYLNPPGGQEFFDKSKYDNAGIKLHFLESSLPPYYQANNSFIPGLSIVDALMFNSPQDVLGMIKYYQFK
jgi:hypothetical protein